MNVRTSRGGESRLCSVRLQTWHQERVVWALGPTTLTLADRLTIILVSRTRGGDQNPVTDISEDLRDYDYTDPSFPLSIILLIQKTPARRCKKYPMLAGLNRRKALLWPCTWCAAYYHLPVLTEHSC